MKSVIVTFRQYVVSLTIVLSLIAILDPLYSVGQEHPSLHGFITDPGSPTSFIVDGINITCTPDTVYTMSTEDKSAPDGEGRNRSGAVGSVGVGGAPRHFWGESVLFLGGGQK